MLKQLNNRQKIKVFLLIFLKNNFFFHKFELLGAEREEENQNNNLISN